MSTNSGWLGGLGAACYRHRWLTVLAWIAGVACLVTLWMRFGAATQNSFTSNDPGQVLLSEHFAAQSGDTLTLAIRSDAPVTSPAVRARVTQVLAPFRQAAHVTGVSNPYTTPGHLSADGHIAYATVQFDVPGSSIPGREATALMNDARAASGDGVTFSLGGDVVDQAETPYDGPSDGIGVAAAAIVLLIAFGSFLAMGLPIATALMGIGSGLALIALLGHVFPAPSFSPIIAALIGLGVGVDYALFIVTRFHADLQDGMRPQDAVVTAMNTAGRAVLTAGTTVVIGMLGLLVLRQALLNGVAIAAAATVAMTVIAALTLLPAQLSFTGCRLARPSRLNTFLGGKVFGRSRTGRHADDAAGSTPDRSEDKEKTPAAQRWAGVVQRHPVLAAAVSAAAILALAAPALAIKLSFPDESAQARGTMGYASYATMTQGFGPGFDAPLIVAAKVTPGDGPALGSLRSAIEATPGIATVSPPVISRDGQAAMLIADPATGEQDAATNALVNRLQDAVLPHSGLTAYLTGPNAANVSFANLIGTRRPAAAISALTASGRTGAPTGSRARFTSTKSLPAASGTAIRSNSYGRTAGRRAARVARRA
jgi:uncharacterized membrane protein YdfJ with MMPL/SSD domain